MISLALILFLMVYGRGPDVDYDDDDWSRYPDLLGKPEGDRRLIARHRNAVRRHRRAHGKRVFISIGLMLLNLDLLIFFHFFSPLMAIVSFIVFGVSLVAYFFPHEVMD